jgi:hypothetical protein
MIRIPNHIYENYIHHTKIELILISNYPIYLCNMQNNAAFELIEALYYKSEDHGFDSRLRHWFFPQLT